MTPDTQTPTPDPPHKGPDIAEAFCLTCNGLESVPMDAALYATKAGDLMDEWLAISSNESVRNDKRSCESTVQTRSHNATTPGAVGWLCK